MIIYFNEQSVIDGEVSGNNIIISLSRSLKIVKELFGQFSIQGALSDLKDITYNGSTLLQYIRQCSDSEAKGLLLSNISRYEEMDSTINVSNFSLAVSLYVDDNFKKPNVEISSIDIRNVPCFHSGGVNVLIERTAFFEQYTDYNEYFSDPLPSKISRLLYSEYFHDIFTQYVRNSSDEKRATIVTLSTLVASFCGFTKSQDLCKKNPGKLIFTKSDSKFILSADFFHGTFEVLDSKGVHLHEINYNGDETKQKDNKGRHNITV